MGIGSPNISLRESVRAWFPNWVFTYVSNIQNALHGVYWVLVEFNDSCSLCGVYTPFTFCSSGDYWINHIFVWKLTLYDLAIDLNGELLDFRSWRVVSKCIHTLRNTKNYPKRNSYSLPLAATHCLLQFICGVSNLLNYIHIRDIILSLKW